MSRVYYNKLIRDGIPQKIDAAGAEYSVRVLEDKKEFEQELLKKVIEESGGLVRAKTREEFLAEYADLMVVLDALTKQLEITPAEIKLALEENYQKKGGFDQRLFLHWSADEKYTSNESPRGIKAS